MCAHRVSPGRPRYTQAFCTLLAAPTSTRRWGGGGLHPFNNGLWHSAHLLTSGALRALTCFVGTLPVQSRRVHWQERHWWIIRCPVARHNHHHLTLQPPSIIRQPLASNRPQRITNRRQPPLVHRQRQQSFGGITRMRRPTHRLRTALPRGRGWQLPPKQQRMADGAPPPPNPSSPDEWSDAAAWLEVTVRPFRPNALLAKLHLFRRGECMQSEGGGGGGGG